MAENGKSQIAGMGRCASTCHFYRANSGNRKVLEPVERGERFVHPLCFVWQSPLTQSFLDIETKRHDKDIGAEK